MRTAETDSPRRVIPVSILALIFTVTYALLFLGMFREPNAYDEGLVLTAAMRVAAGQIPHRDFYANYGPAQFYVLAGLFKLFGQSVLVERLYDLLVKATLTTVVYALCRSFCRRRVAALTTLAVLLWLFSIDKVDGAPVVPISLLNLVNLWLLLPAFGGGISRVRAILGGITAGLVTLFRYDAGLALCVADICVLAVSLWFCGGSRRVRDIFVALSSSAAGWVALFLPVAVYYLAHAPLRPILFDIVLYPSKYYHRGRNLPLPGIHLKYLENVEVYLLIPLIAVSLCVAAMSLRKLRSATPEAQRRIGVLVAFGLLAIPMYLKGVVRMEIQQMYLCIILSLPLLAALYESSLSFGRILQFCVLAMTGLAGIALTWATLHEIKRLKASQYSALEYCYRKLAGTVPEDEVEWCSTSNGLTRGFCFLAGDDHQQAIEYIDQHTQPSDKLFVGLPRHDVIFANDNLTYFAAQRLPATMWSHFDPGLQNSAPIQAQMIAELKAAAPPYVVTTSEFAEWHEPNLSSVSSGVSLLDEYIQGAYSPVESFDRMTILKRKD